MCMNIIQIPTPNLKPVTTYILLSQRNGCSCVLNVLFLPRNSQGSISSFAYFLSTGSFISVM